MCAICNVSLCVYFLVQVCFTATYCIYMKMCRPRFTHSGYLFEWIKCQMQKLYYYVDDLWRMRKDIRDSYCHGANTHTHHCCMLLSLGKYHTARLMKISLKNNINMLSVWLLMFCASICPCPALFSVLAHPGDTVWLPGPHPAVRKY